MSDELEKAKIELEKIKIQLEHERINLEKSKPWWQQSVPWLAPTISALVAVLTLIITNWQTEQARIVELTDARTARAAEERARNDELEADRVARESQAEQNIAALREERETQIILQATKDVSLQQARDNIVFFSKLGYITSKNTQEIEEILRQNTPRTGSSNIRQYPKCPNFWSVRPEHRLVSSKKGLSLHIAAGEFDTREYKGMIEELDSALVDAANMASIANQVGYNVGILKGEHARTDCVLSLIEAAAELLSAGDSFLLTFSGHGSRETDLSEEEPDGLDETWVLYDDRLLDDNLYKALTDFSHGVQVIIVTDASHGMRLRRPPNAAIINASVLMLASAQEDQVAFEKNERGWFTGELLKAWNNGTFAGSYEELYEEIIKNMPSSQTPFLDDIGAQDQSIRSERAFSFTKGATNSDSDAIE